jgi:capsular exopolysaccharide synthesis family protein
MELQNFLRTLWRWSWLILLSSVVGVVSSFYALRSLGHIPVYEARAVVGIGTQLSATPDQNLESFYLSRELAPTYVELATLQPVTQAVIDELQLSLTPQELAENLQANLIPDTQYLHITAVAHDPGQAAAIANAIARQLTVQTPPRLRNFVEVVEPASPPNMPSFRPFIAVFIAGFFGLFLALGIALLLEYLNDTIETAEEITRHSGLPVFGVIQPTQSLLCRLLRPQVTTLGPALTRQPVWWTAIEGCRYMWNGAGPGVGQPSGKRILVTSPGRSEGKTTAAIGIAMAWARTGLNVALVEAHLDQPALGQRLDISGGTGIVALLNGDVPHLEPVLLGTAQSGELQVLVGDKVVQEPLDLIPSPRFQQALEDISRQVGLLVIDGPPILSTAEAPILAGQVDGVLLVVRARKTRLRALKEALKTMELVGGTVLGVVFNKS